MEFQEGGWVHWHLILLGIARIDHADLDRLWGHGHVWIKRMTHESRRYMTKYVAKGDGLPAFLYAERPRSVKVIRTSAGFWRDTQPRPKRPESPPQQSLNAFRPIGESLRQSDATSIVKDEDGKYWSKPIPLDHVLTELSRAGYAVIGRVGSWLELKACGVHGGFSRRTPPLHLRREQNRGSDPTPEGWPSWLKLYFTEVLDGRWSFA